MYQKLVKDVAKDIEKRDSRLYRQISKYCQKYLKDEEGVIGLEISYMVHCQLEAFTERLQRKYGEPNGPASGGRILPKGGV